MRRDWPLVAAGFGIVVLSSLVAVPALLAYRPAEEPCDPPEPPRVLIDGCYAEPGGFEHWISRPGVIVCFALSFVLLIAAIAVIRRGFTSPPLGSRSASRPGAA